MGQIIAAPGGSELNPGDGFEFTDHLFAQVSGTIGRKWQATATNAGSVTVNLSEQNHPGILRFNTNANPAGTMRVDLQQIAGTFFRPLLPQPDALYLEYMVRPVVVPSAAQNFTFNFGLSDFIANSIIGQIRFDGANPTLRLIMTVGGIPTNVDGTLVLIAGTWYRLAFNITDTLTDLIVIQESLGINGVEVSSATVPIAAMAPTMVLTGIAGATNRQVDVDYIYMRQVFT